MSSKHSTKASFEYVFSPLPSRAQQILVGTWCHSDSSDTSLLSGVVRRDLRTKSTEPEERNSLTSPTTIDSNYLKKTFSFFLFSLPPTRGKGPQRTAPDPALSRVCFCVLFMENCPWATKGGKLQGACGRRFVIIIELHYSHGHYKGQEYSMKRPLSKNAFT